MDSQWKTWHADCGVLWVPPTHIEGVYAQYIYVQYKGDMRQRRDERHLLQ